MALNREQHQLEALVDATLQHLNSSRNTLISLLFKIEHEPQNVDWSSTLDNVALVYTQVTNLMRQLKSDKIPVIKNIEFVPTGLTVGDPELEKVTEGRLTVLDQETIPNYLRTRPERDVETYLKDGLPKLQANPEVLQRNIAHMNKAIGQISETIAAAKSASKQREMAAGDLGEMWTNPQETAALLAAVGSGIDLVPGAQRAPVPVQQAPVQAPTPQAPPQGQAGGTGRLNIRINPTVNPAAAFDPSM